MFLKKRRKKFIGTWIFFMISTALQLYLPQFKYYIYGIKENEQTSIICV